MGVDIPPKGLKPKKNHRVVVTLKGPLTGKDAKGLKRDLDRVLDRYGRKPSRKRAPASKKRRKKS